MKRSLRPFVFLVAAICIFLVHSLVSRQSPNVNSASLADLVISVITWLLVLSAGVLFMDLSFFGSDNDMMDFIRARGIWIFSLRANISLMRLSLALFGLGLLVFAAWTLDALFRQ